METRLQLRRRLLRIEDSVNNADSTSRSSSSVVPDDVAVLTSTTAKLRVGAAIPHLDVPGSKPLLCDDGEGDASDESEADEEDCGGDGDEDSGSEDEEEDASTVDSSNNAPAAAAANAATRRSDKCETSPVVKLLFSRHDVTRTPTVCFDYPPHLNVTREYVARASGVALRVVTLSAQDCRLFYRTHWERNCVKNAFAVAGLTRTTKKWSTWHIAWVKHVPKATFKRFRDNSHVQVFNHLPDPWVIGRKDRLMRTLAACKRRFGASYSFFPEGFALPDQMDAFQRAIQREDAVMAALSAIDCSVRPSSSSSSVANKTKRSSSAGSGKRSTLASSIWILKPPASACGRGIRVITAKDVATIGKDRKYVVQRYIANPLLLDGYKFDLRLYVVVTSVDPLRIYVFDDGIARFCTSKYSLETLANRFSHLTNYSVNKTNDHFVENTGDSHTAGSKWSLSALFAHLQHELHILPDPARLQAQIHAIICKTIIAAEAHLVPLVHACRTTTTPGVQCYELFGFDILLDNALTPWLIEVNVSPSLMGGSALDRRIKGLLLSDVFHLVGVPVALQSLPPNVLPTDLEALRRGDAGGSSASLSTCGAQQQQQQQQQQRAPAAPVALPHHRQSSAGRHLAGAASLSAAATSATATAAARRTNSAASARAVSKQLHEVVLDPTIAVFEQRHLSMFSASDWAIVHAMDDEMDRVGHFTRIFPSGDRSDSDVSSSSSTTFAPFFTCLRYSDALCAKWIRTQQRKATKSSRSGSRSRVPLAKSRYASQS